MKLFQKAEGTAGLLRSAGFCLPRNDMVAFTLAEVCRVRRFTKRTFELARIVSLYAKLTHHKIKIPNLKQLLQDSC